MKHRLFRMSVLFVIALLVGMTFQAVNAEARAGGGGSGGSRGSRSYSRPASPPSQSNTYRQAAPQQQRPAMQSPLQSSGGGFLRSMAGGLVGGMLGGMLFRSLGFAGGGGLGGGGIGLFEILLIGGIIYFIYRMVKRKREETPAYQNVSNMESYREPIQYQPEPPAYAGGYDDVATGLAHVRQMDPAFDEQRFSDTVMDIFFKIQGAWMNRDLAPVTGLLTQEMRQVFQGDVERLLRERRINRLENIAVRKVEIAEVWQEAGQDYVTALIYANLLDYTTDDASGHVVEGSKTEPVKFEEYWTFTRPVGNNPWRLSAINQK
ncbi:MAG: Tim44 domain-containing protein [Deltaproteobacteria bacterium]|nr:Tim44 domain-containing protein [Deltaproteobacteria bacterium]